MSSLQEILCSEANRANVVQDATRLVDQEVDQKSGLTGLAVKTAYKVVCKLKPGLVAEVVDNLLERFVTQVEPFFAEWVTSGKRETFEGFLTARKNRVANALLSVTDERARAVQNTTLKKSYETLRPHGEKHVEAAVPGLAKMLARYV